MRKRIMGMILSLTMLMGCVPIIVGAETSGTCGENVTWTLDDNGTLTISGEGKTEDYKASQTDSVINSPWFPLRDKIKSIVIEEGVTELGWYAFRHCTTFTSITIPKSLKKMNWGAIDNCKGLKEVHISDLAAWCNIKFVNSSPMYYADKLYLNGELITDLVIPDGITEIGGAFSGYKALTSVTIPDSVKEIGGFSGCDGLTDIVLPDSIEIIERSAFSQCKNLKNINLPSSVKWILPYAFDSCEALENVYITDLSAYLNINMEHNPMINARNLYLNNEKIAGDLIIPNGVKHIPYFAFHNCSEITSVMIPDGVTYIATSAFNACAGLTSVAIPDSVTDIAAYAFRDCSSLESVAIPDSVTYIGDEAFDGCTDLKSAVIGNGVKRLGEDVFRNCGSLTDIYYNGTRDQWNAINIEEYNNNLNNVNIHYTEIVRTDAQEDTEYKFIAELANPRENCYVYAAVYDADGVLLGVSCVPLLTEGATAVSVGKAENAVKAKVFVWTDSMQSVISRAAEFPLT